MPAFRIRVSASEAGSARRRIVRYARSAPLKEAAGVAVLGPGTPGGLRVRPYGASPPHTSQEGRKEARPQRLSRGPGDRVADSRGALKGERVRLRVSGAA